MFTESRWKLLLLPFNFSLWISLALRGFFHFSQKPCKYFQIFANNLVATMLRIVICSWITVVTVRISEYFPHLSKPITVSMQFIPKPRLVLLPVVLTSKSRFWDIWQIYLFFFNNKMQIDGATLCYISTFENLGAVPSFLFIRGLLLSAENKAQCNFLMLEKRFGDWTALLMWYTEQLDC